MGLHSYSSSYPQAGTYSRDHIYATGPTVKWSPFVSKNILFNDSDDSACATYLREDVSHKLSTTFSSLTHTKTVTRPLFSIRKAAMKGRGLFARRALAPGTTILTEHPLLIVAKVPVNLSTLLGPKEEDKFRTLSNSKRDEFETDLEGIMQTNAVTVTLLGDGDASVEHFAVFMNLSRCNHSCSPNTYWKWDPKTLIVRLEAVRPIARGEEITHQYIDSCISYSQRRETLASLFGFNCVCSLCIQWDHKKSDQARAELRAILRRMPTFEEWCSSAEIEDCHLIKLAERVLELRGAEGLEVSDSRRQMELIAMCYGALAETDKFKMWVQRWLDYWTGRPVGDRLVMELWLEDPARFYVWGWRRSQA